MFSPLGAGCESSVPQAGSPEPGLGSPGRVCGAGLPASPREAAARSRASCKTFNSPTHAGTSAALFLQDRQQFLLTYLSDEGIESSV